MPGPSPGDFTYNYAELLSDGVPFSNITCLEVTLPSPCQVPAAKLRHVADKARVELGEHPLASNSSSANNACRDAHNFVNRWGLSWKIPYSYLPLHKDGVDIQVPYISPISFLKFLMTKHPELLHGGISDPELGEKYLESFWANYREAHPSHAMFQEAGHPDRKPCNTLCLGFHGDEGRGLKRGNTCVLMMESVLGLMETEKPKDSTRCQTCSLGKSTAKMFNLKEGYMDCSKCGGAPLCARLVTNYKQHSFLTKFVLSVLPHSYFKDTDFLDRLMDTICADFKDLFENGFELSDGKKIFASVVGFKGDLEWYQAIACLSRCFSKQIKIGEPMCHQCMAGKPSLPFEDTSHSPAWETTEFSERPWNDEPCLTSVPFDSQQPEKILRRDVFHNFKLGTLRDFIGGTVLLLCSLGYFTDPEDYNGRDALLARAHAHFRLWCHTTGKSPSLRSFTSTFFNITTWHDFAWVNCKGSDTSLCVSWLRVLTSTLLLDLKSEDHRQTLETMRRCAIEGERFFKIIYDHGLFLNRHCAAAVYESLHNFLDDFNRLAFLALYKHKYTAYAKKSKMHMMAHEKQDIRKMLMAGKRFVLSPLAFACEQNEDMVGRLSRLSRRVSQRWAAHRTLDLYLIQCKAVHRRYVKVRKTKLKCKTLR